VQIEKMRSRNQFRTITIAAMPADGKLASEVMSAARSKLNELQQTLPAGYRLEVGGQEEEQVKGFIDLTIVLLISVAAIFGALVFQFKNAINRSSFLRPCRLAWWARWRHCGSWERRSGSWSLGGS
jgi:multidrug efflux pump subunit AcrB